MKVEFSIDKVIIYLYQYNLSINNIDILSKEIKNIFASLIKKYNIDFFGYLKVNIYNNSKYGNIIEINKIIDNNLYSNIIDLKITVYKDYPMYFEFDNYYDDILPIKTINKEGKYLININKVENILKYIEYGKINY